MNDLLLVAILVFSAVVALMNVSLLLIWRKIHILEKRHDREHEELQQLDRKLRALEKFVP